MRQLLVSLLALATATSISGCALFSRNSAPDLEPDAAHLEHIVILGTNDLHGSVVPVPYVSQEKDPKDRKSYTRGGLALLAKHIQEQRKLYGNRLIVIDAGDGLHGSLESNLLEGAPLTLFFNLAGYKAAALGNHEFDFGPTGTANASLAKPDRRGALRLRLSESSFPYLAANLIDESTRHLPELPNLMPHTLVHAGRLKVGIIGLMTSDPTRTARPENFAGLRVTDLAAATLKSTQELRAAGADVVLLSAHVGIACETDGDELKHRLRSPPQTGAPRASNECDGSSELVSLLRNLPTGTIDAVVSGQSHTLVHHWVAGVPVIQSASRGEIYHLIHLTYDTESKKLVSQQTRIEGPIPVCEKVFSEQGDCFGSTPVPANGRGKLVTASLYGKRISPDFATQAQLLPSVAQARAVKNKIIAIADRPIPFRKNEESPLGNLVADALRSATGADVAFVNPGGIRADLEAGPITYDALFRAIPFDNPIAILDLSGAELKTLLRVVQNGSRGWYPISGARLELVRLSEDADSSDLNQNRLVEPWEINRLIDVTLDDGERIRDGKTYRVATLAFLAAGGDDLGWVMGRMSRDAVKTGNAGTLREVVKEYLSGMGKVNTVEQPLVQWNSPRIVALSAPTRKSRRGRSLARTSSKKKHR